MAKKKTNKRSTRILSFSDTHPGHNDHLCELVRRRSMAKVARLSAGAKYMCGICGRASAKSSSVCDPVHI